MGTSNEFDLPEEILEVIPSDPFAQLDVARKITSIALSTRVSVLESEASVLRDQLTDKENIIAHLTSQVESLDASLSDTSDRLARAEQEKESLLKENSLLSNTVGKLRRDVSKLEVFRKTLMQSLQEDDENSATGVKEVTAKEIPTQASFSTQLQSRDEDATLPSPSYSLPQTETSEHETSEDCDKDASRPRISHGLLLASQTSTPRLTPPGSPPIVSASASPKTSKPPSPRRHSVSFSTSRGMFDSLPSSTHSSFSSTDGGSQSGEFFRNKLRIARTRIDGKEFFRQVRSRLSYEQFGAFLANVKELNSHKQTKEETLRKADEIFGSDNRDLYTIFEGLLIRNIQ